MVSDIEIALFEARNVTQDFSASFAYQALAVALGAYLEKAKGRDPHDVAGEMAHLRWIVEKLA